MIIYYTKTEDKLNIHYSIDNVEGAPENIPFYVDEMDYIVIDDKDLSESPGYYDVIEIGKVVEFKNKKTGKKIKPKIKKRKPK